MKTKTRIIIASVVLLAFVAACGVYAWFGILMPKWEAEQALKQAMQEYYNNKLLLYYAENLSYEDYEIDVAFLGDSLTEGCDLEKYYPQYKTANRGIGGETTHGLEKRLKVSVYDLKPKVAVMLIGGNNLDTMMENYESILQGLQTNLPDTKIVLVSLTAMGAQWAEKNSLASENNVKIRQLAEKYGYTYVDVFTPLYDGANNTIHTEYTVEGLHLTDKGYEVLSAAITPAIEAALQTTKE
jgi:lysophospholipase L1-like esterase